MPGLSKKTKAKDDVKKVGKDIEKAVEKGGKDVKKAGQKIKKKL
jgi:predicted small secreted protein